MLSPLPLCVVFPLLLVYRLHKDKDFCFQKGFQHLGDSQQILVEDKNKCNITVSILQARKEKFTEILNVPHVTRETSNGSRIHLHLRTPSLHNAPLPALGRAGN